jgi:hypothetical protein
MPAFGLPGLGVPVFGTHGLSMTVFGLRGLGMTVFGLRRLGIPVFGLQLSMTVFGLRGQPRFGRNMVQREHRKERGEADGSDATEAERPISSSR